MKSPNSGRNRTAAVYHQMNLPVLNGLHRTMFLAKGIPQEPQMTQTIAKAIACPPHADSQAQLQKTTPAQLSEHGEVELVELEPSHLWTSVNGTGRSSAL